MERIPFGKYSKEFRQEAVKLVIEGGLSSRPCYKTSDFPPMNRRITREEFDEAVRIAQEEGDGITV